MIGTITTVCIEKEKMTMEPKRAQWGSKIGFILAAAGSAVGLGNIWKFPGKAYEGGGGAYILIYLAIVLLIGIPVMLSELTIGRGAPATAIDSYGKLGHPGYKWVGWFGVIVAFIITSYYCHVGGWVLRYVASYATEPTKVYADPLGYFYALLGYNAVTGETWFPLTAVIFAGIFMGITCFIIVKGVESGIERFNKIGMPALFVILIILLIRALTMPGAGEGLQYMLIPDWSKVTFSTVLSALGQAFFSLSLGMAIMVTYGSYVKKEENLAKNAAIICGMDTLVALIAGFIIVPAVFATLGAEGVGKGAGFAFSSLAGVFQQMPGGQFFGILFYMLLLFAALTSCISLVEGVVAFATERFGWKRTPTTIILCVVMFLLGTIYTCSQAAFDIKGIWFDFKNGLTTPIFGDFMEFLTDRLMIPVCALGSCLFVGWAWKPQNAIREIELDGKPFRLKKAYSFLVKYLAPISIIIIIVASFATGTTLS